MRPLRRWATIVGSCLTAILATPALSFAHATLLSSDPAAGSRLAMSPTVIRLKFSEPLEPTLGRVLIIASAGDTTKLSVAGDPHDVYVLVANVDKPLADGGYRVRWRVVSTDGHPVGGSFSFTVARVATAKVMPMPAATDTSMSDAAIAGMQDSDMASGWGPSVGGAPVIPALLRGIEMGSMMAAMGLLLFLALPRANTGPAPRAETLARAMSIVASAMLLVHMAVWIIASSPEHRIDGDSAGIALNTSIGHIELWRTGLALLAVWALALARRIRLSLLFASAALIVSGATGHSAAIHPLWSTPAKTLHLVAGAVWLGGLLWLLLLDRNDISQFAHEAERVSRAALMAVVVVAFSGVVQTRLFLPAWLDLVRSPYGLVALAKVAGLIVLVAFGAHHRYRVVPRLRDDADVPRRFTVTVRREVIVMAVVIFLGGLLAYMPPPGVDHSQMQHSHQSLP